MIGREEARIDAALAPWAERLQGRRVLLYTGGVKSWSVVSALQGLGMTVVATDTKKSTEEDKPRIPFLDINQEREFGYAGYVGMLELVRQLALTLEAPLGDKVRAPAPWATRRTAGEPLAA